jgi:ATP-dependent DNA ligase
MEARQEAELPRGEGWQYEPKWDGFRCLALRDGDAVELLGRSGKSLSRYFPEMIEALGTLKARRFILDGELTIPVGGVLSFEELQMRLHPAASRVRKLAAAHPSLLIVFDMLETPRGADLTARPLRRRRAALEKFMSAVGPTKMLRLSPATDRRTAALKWLKRAGQGELDGVVAKRLDDPYLAGKRAMIKVKNLRTADCVVGGFRYAGTGKQAVGSLLLGLFDAAGKLDHVGFVSGFADRERKALLKKLKPLIGGAGFTGDVPGGPSRWSTERSEQWEPLKTRLVVEVQYDHVTGDRFRHATRFVRWRPDKRPRDCTKAQLRAEASPAA